MTRQEYEDLQERLSAKLHSEFDVFVSQKCQDAYEHGLKVAKSIVRSVYHKYADMESENDG